MKEDLQNVSVQEDFPGAGYELSGTMVDGPKLSTRARTLHASRVSRWSARSPGQRVQWQYKWRWAGCAAGISAQGSGRANHRRLGLRETVDIQQALIGIFPFFRV